MSDDIQAVPRATWDELLGTDETPGAEWTETDKQLGIAMGLGSHGLWIWGGD